MFSVSINAKNVVITFVEAVRLEYFPKDFLTDLIHSKYWCIMILHLEKQGMSCLEQSQFV